MQSSNDDHFDPKTQLLTLTEEQAIEYAKTFFDDNCGERDAAFFNEVITAGERSPDVIYQHAMGGSPLAQCTYGVAKLEGVHVEQEVSEGLFWLLRSYNNGNAKAAIVLAGAYMQGEHVALNLKKAFLYASFAAEQGLPDGKFVLANLLIGVGDIPEDQERAVDLLQASARSGYKHAIDMLENNGIPLE